MNMSIKSLTAVIVTVAGLTTSSFADPVDASAGDPSARVGRVSLLQGTVSWHQADGQQWRQAELNYPVTSGNDFWTEPGSLAEIRVGSTAMRLDGGTELDVKQLDDQTTHIAVPQGTINLHMERYGSDELYEVDTPRGTVELLAPGSYRIDAGGGGAPTDIAVLHGQARFVTDRMLTVTSGETAIVSGANPLSYRVQVTVPTKFDDWSLARDNYERPHGEVVNYVSTEVTGYEDLETYGTWKVVPDYGSVWVPTDVPVGWAPYRQGHWAWVAPWGWTWVDQAPWGFAPFHYGRWAFVGGTWCWAPPAVSVAIRPVYAPALVAFVGGNGWRVSLGVGAGLAVGWFPLAPNEPYIPAYRVSDSYVRNVNITNVSNVTNITNVTNVSNYRYANFQHTVVVPQQSFAAGHPVSQVAMNVPFARLQRTTVNYAPPAVGNMHGFTPATWNNHATQESTATTVPHPNFQPGRQLQPVVHTPPSSAAAPSSPTQPYARTATDQPRSAARPGKQMMPWNSEQRQPAAAPEPVRNLAPPQHPQVNSYHQAIQRQHMMQPQIAPQQQLHEVRVQHPQNPQPLHPSQNGWTPAERHAQPPVKAPNRQPEQHAAPDQRHERKDLQNAQ